MESGKIAYIEFTKKFILDGCGIEQFYFQILICDQKVEYSIPYTAQKTPVIKILQGFSM